MGPGCDLTKGTNVKQLAMILAGAALFSGAASAATDAAAATPADGHKSHYVWLHPKLGMVKVDRATNAMVVSGHDTTGRANTRTSVPQQ